MRASRKRPSARARAVTSPLARGKSRRLERGEGALDRSVCSDDSAAGRLSRTRLRLRTWVASSRAADELLGRPLKQTSGVRANTFLRRSPKPGPIPPSLKDSHYLHSDASPSLRRAQLDVIGRSVSSPLGVQSVHAGRSQTTLSSHWNVVCPQCTFVHGPPAGASVLLRVRTSDGSSGSISSDDSTSPSTPRTMEDAPETHRPDEGFSWRPDSHEISSTSALQLTAQPAPSTLSADWRDRFEPLPVRLCLENVS